MEGEGREGRSEREMRKEGRKEREGEGEERRGNTEIGRAVRERL